LTIEPAFSTFKTYGKGGLFFLCPTLFRQAIYCNNKSNEYSEKAKMGLVFYTNMITNLN